MNDCVLEYSKAGSRPRRNRRRCGFKGNAVRVFLFKTPDTWQKCIFPRVCTAGEAGTRDANQDRDGGAGGVRYERGNIT